MRQRIKSLKLLQKKPFCILLLLFCAFLLFCIFCIIRPNKSYVFEGVYHFEQGTPTEETVIYDGISLKPGVYYVELYYSSSDDAGISHCNLKDGTVFTGGLLCNGEHLYGALDRTGYYAWLYESTEQLQVVVTYDGTSELTTGKLVMTETNYLWSKLLVEGVFAMLVVLGTMLYHYYRLAYGVDERKRRVFFFCALISLIVSIPYLHEGLISGADLTYHLHRIGGVRDGIFSGQFPVRLEPRWVYGHGYADAIFYCNSLLLFPAVLEMLGFTMLQSYCIYCIALNIATTVIAYYCFSRIYDSHVIGLVCSALYTISIFRIYKLTITSAVGEGSAFTFLPLVLYGLFRVFVQDHKEKSYKTCWIPIAIGYAGLIQTHVLTCEITAFLTILLCLISIRRIFRWETFVQLAKGASVAIGVSFWYLVPFVDYYLTQDLHIKHVSARTIQDRGLLMGQLAFQFWKNGYYTPLGDNGMQYSHPVGLGFILCLGFALFWILLFVGAFGEVEKSRKRPAIVAAGVGSLLLVMSLNIFPWDRIQRLGGVAASLVSSLQFPNRFLGWGTACAVMVCGFLLWYLSTYGGERSLFYMSIVVMVAGMITGGIHLLDHVVENQSHYNIYSEEGMRYGYISGAEYLIEGTDESKLTFMPPLPGEGVSVASYQKDYLHIEMDCINELSKESKVTVPLLAYKGYEAKIQDTGEPLAVEDGDNHLVEVRLPAHFTGKVTVEFVSPIYWRISEGVSLLLVTGLIVFRVIRRKRA